MKANLFDVFLCHNSLDKEIVTDIETRLRARAVRCWLDRHELRPGRCGGASWSTSGRASEPWPYASARTD
jgi:TIR domain